jgi:hypothetical protein
MCVTNALGPVSRHLARVLEVHGYCGEQGLYFHVFEPPADGSVQSMKRLGGAVRAFHPPAVAGVDRVFFVTPCRAFAPGPQDGRMVGDDMHPTGWHALRQALCLERATRAVAPVGTIPLAGFRAVTGFEPLLRRTPDNVVMGIELESSGRKALRAPAARGAKGRNDRFDLASFKRGVYPPHAIDRVRRDPVRGSPNCVFDGVEALFEPARVMLRSQSRRRTRLGVTSTTTPSWSSTAVCCL